MSLLTFDDVTESGQARIRLLTGSGLSNTTWFSRLRRLLRGIRPLLAKSRLLFRPKPASVFTLVPGIPGIPGIPSIPGIPGIPGIPD